MPTNVQGSLVSARSAYPDVDMKMTLGEAETKRQKAVEFLHRVGNDDAADRFDDMDAAEYAEHRGAQIVGNPKRRATMANQYAVTKTKADLQDELDEARDYIEQLEGRLSIVGVANGDEDDQDEDEDENEDDDVEQRRRIDPPRGAAAIRSALNNLVLDRQCVRIHRLLAGDPLQACQDATVVSLTCLERDSTFLTGVIPG
jgi:hypothetical protein